MRTVKVADGGARPSTRARCSFECVRAESRAGDKKVRHKGVNPLIYSPAPKGWSHCVASPNEAQGLL